MDPYEKSTRTNVRVEKQPNTISAAITKKLLGKIIDKEAVKKQRTKKLISLTNRFKNKALKVHNP